MNSTLINCLDGCNQLLAFIIIIAGTVVGAMGGNGHPMWFMYALVGFIASIVVASVVCGLLATVIEIERHLRSLAEQRQTPAL